MPTKCYTYQLNRFFLLDAFLCVPFLKGRKYFYGTKRKTKMLGSKFVLTTVVNLLTYPRKENQL